jgi:hypothetical protein
MNENEIRAAETPKTSAGNAVQVGLSNRQIEIIKHADHSTDD